mmetsp:Transcript_19840/g.32915  ORF Transcript_19840/g.32915 Transcript_19840/m.32915 type:complete len:569 (+) Transcript_19840:2-1708(+)
MIDSVSAEEENRHRKNKKVKETDWPTVSPSPSKNNGKNNNKNKVKETDAPSFRPTPTPSKAPVISTDAPKIPTFAPVDKDKNHEVEATSAPVILTLAPAMPVFAPVVKDKNNNKNDEKEEDEGTSAPVIPTLAPVMPVFAPAVRGKNNNKNDKNGEDELTSAPVISTLAPAMPVFSPVVKDKNGKNQEVEETDEPTVAPIFRPNLVPTTAPIMPPVSDPTPVLEPTPAPIAGTTATPSDGPGPTESFAPSMALVVSRVFLPKMEFEFRVTEGPVVKRDLETEIRLFIKDVVVSNAKILGELSGVELDVSVSLHGRRRLEAKLVANLAGAAFFEGDPYPSSERLKEVLTAYFANWGDADLEDHLTSGNVQVQGVKVTIDGELVESLSPDTNTNRAIPNEEGGNDSKGVSPGLAIGLVIGCTLVAGALVLAYAQRRKKGKAGKDEGPSPNSTPMSSPSRKYPGGLEAPPPEEISPTNFHGRDDLSFSGISMDDRSLYTDGTPRSKGMYPHSSQNSDTKQYDHTRLDKVISGAHDFVATHEEDHEEKDQDSFPSYDDDSTIESIEGHRAYI